MSTARIIGGMLAVLALGLVGVATFQIVTADSLTQPAFQRSDPSVAASESGWADESTCADCHEQAEQFHRTGHAQTLTAAGDEASWKRLKLLLESEIGRKEQVQYSREADQVYAVRSNGDDQSVVPVEWCFGSGLHAQTWASPLQDGLGQTDLLEFRWTWYRHNNSFGITPGQPENCGNGHLAQFGLQFDGARAWRCFRCHATRISSDQGHLDLQQMHPGVQCQSCHGPRQAHVASEGEVHDETWVFGDRDDQVQRCAECHRSSLEQEEKDLFPGNPDIARFQPIGLSQSRCFTESQMSCTTCHDVHRPMAEQEPRRISQCVQCHDPQSDHSTCAAGMNDRCIDCHMPKVDTGRGLKFTDHWIRIPQPGEAVE